MRRRLLISAVWQFENGAKLAVFALAIEFDLWGHGTWRKRNERQIAPAFRASVKSGGPRHVAGAAITKRLRTRRPGEKAVEKGIFGFRRRGDTRLVQVGQNLGGAGKDFAGLGRNFTGVEREGFGLVLERKKGVPTVASF